METRECEIKKCEEHIRKLYDSNENKRRMQLWGEEGAPKDYIWHPHPKEKGKMPYSFEIERIGYAQMMGFDLVKFYKDPIEFVLQSLKMSIFKFETFPEDCTPISKVITYWPGVGFDASLLGLEQVITDNDAWLGRKPIYEQLPTRNTMEYPDFFNNDVMKRTHLFFSEMKRIISEDFTVNFPQWCRSPWSVAWAVRGIDNLLFDYCDNPEGVEEFLDTIADYRIRWSKQRAEYLGGELYPTNFYNDEVLSPVVSPALYEEIILPSEKKISEAFGGINYWHSCGNTTPFMELINTIPNVTMVHVSPWSDVWHAADVYNKDKIIECALNPLDDVMTPSNHNHVSEKIKEIKEATKDHFSVCRADGFEVIHDVKTDIRILNDWIDTANKLLL